MSTAWKPGSAAAPHPPPWREGDLPATPSDTSAKIDAYRVGLLWVAGVALAGMQAGGALFPTPIFLVIDAVYVAAAVFVTRRAKAAAATDHDATLATPLIASAVFVFALASLTGIPTAEHPGAMLANTTVLLVIGGVLLASTVLITARLWDGPGRAPAALALTALGLGSAGYLANLVARAAVILSGASPAQVAVEKTAWQANAYLRGLPGDPEPMAIMLVWLDLLQLTYVMLTHLAVIALTIGLRRATLISTRAADRVVLGGALLVGLTTTAAALGVTGAFDVPVLGAASEAGATAAYILTAPFMTTLLPFALGAALLCRSGRPSSGHATTAPSKTFGSTEPATGGRVPVATPVADFFGAAGTRGPEALVANAGMPRGPLPAQP
ncbi:hypothetical protein CC117_24465 [Parafrankia colletiae]|uniref:Uncharacterized protein n=1 Tax=Parafrankia colletiae TaxID=573497 RepID=A0A1S1QHG3_9ACTN|nr:hypothetical protein [Parafrankia colletiae]MCK9901661.1 hypothetical protein [Frankia sp. Cpl3]OHV32705.1 hypothetical protein CC117_24465 [Parafrankia colletiae]